MLLIDHVSQYFLVEIIEGYLHKYREKVKLNMNNLPSVTKWESKDVCGCRVHIHCLGGQISFTRLLHSSFILLCAVVNLLSKHL